MVDQIELKERILPLVVSLAAPPARVTQSSYGFATANNTAFCR